MQGALQAAAEHGVTLVVEPEVANVVNSAAKARRLLDEMESPQLKIVIDGANIFPAGTLPHQHRILDEAFSLLGDDIVLAHAKDLNRDGAAGNMAAGTGLLDYDHYLSLLHGIGFNGPLILHGLVESQVEQAVGFLQRGMQKVARRSTER
jgi:sugar phosphate isomerase/epimerase